MGGFLILLSIAVVVSFFAFREGKNTSKPSSYNSMCFAKNRLIKDKNRSKEKIKEFNNAHSLGNIPGSDNSDPDTIYVFVSSKKYHKEGCRFANQNSDPVSIETARSRKLSPCKICRPDKG